MVRVDIVTVAKVMKKLSNNEQKLKQLLKYWFSFSENIDTFSKFIFPEYIVGNVPNFHNEFYNIFLQDGHDAIAAPRGHAKSTTIGLVFISWNLVNKIEKYIVYMSQNHTKTVQFIEPINVEFKTNTRLKWLYGDLSPKKNKDEFGRDREDCIDINGCRVEAVSYNKNLRGFKYGNMRPTLIIGDDIDDDERVINPIMRDRDRKKLFEIVINSLDINGRFKIVGTIIHQDCLLKTCINKFLGKIYKAIDDKGNILWKERFSKTKLLEIRDGKGKKEGIGTSAFAKEYLNNPIDNETSTIKIEDVVACYDYSWDYSYEDMDEVYLGVDFAFSDRITADASAFVDVGIKDKKKHILNIRWKKGLSLPKQLTYIRSLHEAHNYSIIGVEENSIKSTSSDIHSLGLPIKMFWTGSRDSVQKDSNKKGKSYSKVNAVERLSVEFENRMWVIPYKTEEHKKIASTLSSELTSWGKEDGKLVELGVHPDSPIGMIMVNEILNKPRIISSFINKTNRNTEVVSIEDKILKNINNNVVMKELPIIE